MQASATREICEHFLHAKMSCFTVNGVGQGIKLVGHGLS
jgi:hypothetical protein